jgi:hypothetical protein
MNFAVGNVSDIYTGMNTTVQYRIPHVTYRNYLVIDCCNAISFFRSRYIESLMSNIVVHLTVLTCAVTVHSEHTFEPKCGRSKINRSVIPISSF